MKTVKSYTILSIDNAETSTSATKFFEALYTKDEHGKPLYYWIDDGEYINGKYQRGNNNVLLPRESAHFTEVYRVHHNDIARQEMAGIRRFRAGNSNVSPGTENEDGEPCEREIVDERAERDIYANVEHAELIEHLYIVLDELNSLDKEIVSMLYGLDGEPPMTKTACAAALNKNWRMVSRAEERALAKLRELLADFADYDF